jgi:hypothetical protein
LELIRHCGALVLEPHPPPAPLQPIAVAGTLKQQLAATPMLAAVQGVAPASSPANHNGLSKAASGEGSLPLLTRRGKAVSSSTLGTIRGSSRPTSPYGRPALPDAAATTGSSREASSDSGDSDNDQARELQALQDDLDDR